MDVMDKIKQQIESRPIMVFMKGTPEFPQCGFSARAVQALQACGAEFDHVNVLAEPDVRQNLPRYANWPTFPQVYINGELVGGSDIIIELYQRGELQELLESAAHKGSAAAP